MAPEGMVHALESIRNLLAPSGMLVDIHPSDEKARLILTNGRRRQQIAFLEETDDYIEYRLADQAVARVLEEGIYRLESSDCFWFTIQAPSLPDLEQFLQQEWKDAVIPIQAWDRLSALQNDAHAPGAIQLRERIRINVLFPRW